MNEHGESHATGYGASNVIFTIERADEVKEVLCRKLDQLGIEKIGDPER